MISSICIYPHNTFQDLYFTALSPKYRRVDDAIIRGPHPSLKDLIELKKEGVNQIYDFRHYSNFGLKWIERLACKIIGIDYQRKAFSFFYKRPQLKDFEEISKSVYDNSKRGGITLFHCNSGTHRTSLFSAYCAITKGEKLEKCFSDNPNYLAESRKIIDKEIFNTNFFSRNAVQSFSYNPIKYVKNIFNNKVVKNTSEALNDFFNMLHYKADV